MPATRLSCLLAILVLCVVASWGFSADAAVVVNEFLASNSTGLLDEDGDTSDWIEIHNTGGSPVGLSGWSLSDNAALPYKWSFPDISIGAGGYLIVFASGKDRRPTSGELHSNFSLEKNGEFLALYSGGVAQAASTFSPGYPEQRADFSYGTKSGSNDFWYFDTPTPGAANTGGNAYLGFAGEVIFSHAEGLFSSNFQLTLSTLHPTTVLRYTTDGTLPTGSSPLYAAPLSISASTLVRVLPTGPDLVPGAVVSRGYIKLAADMIGFSSNLPIVIMDSFGYDIDAESGTEGTRPIWPFRPVYSVIIDVGGDGRAHIDDPPNYVGRAGMRVRGNSSQGMPKKQYTFETWNEYDEDKDTSVLGFPAESDWVLHSPYGDKSLMRNFLAYNWARELGIHAMGAKHVEVFFNSNSGAVSLDLGSTGDYRGVYVLIEKIKQGENRVAITKIEPSDTTEPNVTGGYIVAMDIMDDNELAMGWQTTLGNPPWYNWNGFVPNDPGVAQIAPAQLTYIKGYINDFEAALYGPSFDDPAIGYRQLGEVDTFADYHLYTELLMNADSYYGSMFMNKDRLGKLRMGPIWDWNVSMGGTSDWSVPDPTAWHYDRVGGGVFWFERLLQDAEYRLLFADKYYVWRHNNITTSKLVGDVIATAAFLDEAQQRNFTRWPILGQWIPTPSQLNYGDWASRTVYQDEIDYLTNWLTTRMNWLDTQVGIDQAPAPPTFSQQGGEVSPGFSLTITANGTGTVYYTTDGSDPYQRPSASHTAASTTLIADSAAKKALVPTVSNPADTTWRSSTSYSETGWASGSAGVGYEEGSGYETFIGIDVGADMFGAGGNTSCYVRIPFTASLASLSGYNTLKLRMRWDDGFIAYLNGAKIEERDAPASPAWDSAAVDADEEASSVWLEYDVSAYLGNLIDGQNLLAIHGLNEGNGSSDFLIAAELIATQEVVGNPGGASPSALVYSSALTINGPVSVQTRRLNVGDWSALNVATFETTGIVGELRISEIMYHPAAGGAEYIELQNISNSAINISGVFFSNGITYTFPPNTVLQPGQIITLVSQEDAAAFAALYPGADVFGYYLNRLSNSGETVTVSAADATVLDSVTYNDAAPWPTSADGQGFSLVLLDPGADPDNPTSWRASTNAGGSPGTTVAPPSIVAVVINEALTHTDLPLVDTIEIHNPTGSTADIRGWYLTDDRLTPKKALVPNQAQFQIPAGGFVTIDEDTFAFSPGAGMAGFLLSSRGEGVYLYSANGSGDLTGYSHGFQFGASENGRSFGRHVSSDAKEHFVAQASNTLGSANAGPKVGPLVISEIYYDPTGGDVEYLEVTNISGSEVDLWDLSAGGNPNNTYQINGVNYTFPGGTSILPSGAALLVNSATPEDFNTPYGPFGGAAGLDGGGERISILWPDKPELFEVPLITMDSVRYDDASPWPNAIGNGKALRRTNLGAFGDDPSNWQAVTPTHNPGGPAPGSKPVVWAAFGFSGTELGTQGNPFNTWEEAMAAVQNGGSILIRTDGPLSASPWTGRITKSFSIGTWPSGTAAIGKQGVKSITAKNRVSANNDLSAQSVDSDAWQKFLQALMAGFANSGTPGEGGALILDKHIYAPVMPFSRAGGLRIARPRSDLALRLRHVDGISENSIWVRDLDLPTGVRWRPVAEKGTSDIWVILEPRDIWSVGIDLEVSSGASSALGEALESASYEFRIEEENPKGTAIWQPEAGVDFDSSELATLVDSGNSAQVSSIVSALPDLPGGIGDPVTVGPEEVFDVPQLVWLPVPLGVDPSAVGVFYYHNSSDEAGWYPAENVDGWLAQDSLLHLDLSDTVYLGFLARHAAIVQLGDSP